jgi:hypothetical protein
MQNLKVNDRVDALDSSLSVLYEPVWLEAKVVAAQPGTVTVSFRGWGNRWNETIATDSSRLAPLFSHTKNWRATLRRGNWVEVRLFEKWHRAQVQEIDGNQVRVKVSTRLLSGAHREIVINLDSDNLTYHYMHYCYEPRPRWLPEGVFMKNF